MEYRVTEKQLKTLKKITESLRFERQDLERELKYLAEDIEGQPLEDAAHASPESAKDEPRQDWVKWVEEFNRRCGVARFGGDYPGVVARDAARLQLRLIDEEISELRAAYEGWLLRDENPAEIVDAVCDSVYVLLGLGYVMGFDLSGAFAEVHRSNMSKFDKDGRPIRRKDGKIMKSELFTPPNLEPFVGGNLIMED